MQLLLLLAGLILLIAGSSWFTGAYTVGVICLTVFAVMTLLQFVALRVATLAADKVRDRLL